MGSTGNKEVINFKVDGKLFQSDGALYLNHVNYSVMDFWDCEKWTGNMSERT